MFRNLILSSLIVFSVGNVHANNELNCHEALKAISCGFSQVAKKAVPAVVYIESQVTKKTAKKEKRPKGSDNPFDYFQDDFFNRFFGFPEQEKKPETVRGSGFVVSKDGYIMTNNHVVENAQKVTVTFTDGKKLLADVVGTDPKTDLALIKVKADNLPYLTFGNSDKLEVGDWAIAVGNPFGLEASVTVGVVSAKGRSQLHIIDFEDFIQTDAAINPGNSGGPLLNIDSEVIGINTAIVSGSGGYMGVGFAIPSNMASLVYQQLAKTGNVTRGFLGVTLQPVDADLADYYKLERAEGALVTDVAKDSPAEKGGLKQEDLILSYNGNKVESLTSFRNAVSFMAPGTKLHLKVLRDGKIKELDMTVGSTPSDEKKEEAKTAKLGLEVQNLTSEIAERLGYEKERKGVVVTSVDPLSLAAQAEIAPGSLILAVNRQKVTTVDEFLKAVNEAESQGSILLMVKQGEAIRFIALRP